VPILAIKDLGTLDSFWNFSVNPSGYATHEGRIMEPKADSESHGDVDSHAEYIEDLKRSFGFDEYVASLLTAKGCKPAALVQQVKNQVNPRVIEETR
jgi:hypothetical protein